MSTLTTFLTQSVTKMPNKTECLSVWYTWARPESAQVGAPLEATMNEYIPCIYHIECARGKHQSLFESLSVRKKPGANVISLSSSLVR